MKKKSFENVYILTIKNNWDFIYIYLYMLVPISVFALLSPEK